MKTPVYIVTGATGGIGGAIVDGLARDHAPCHIIMAVRNTDRGRAAAGRITAPGVKVDVMRLDLASLASVREFVTEIRDAGITVDALINNAGTMPGGVTVTADGFEAATQTNFVATALLTRGLLPSMADGASIVFTTSVTRYLPRLHDDWERRAIDHHQRFITYGRSKLMLTHYALHLAEELRRRSIRVNCSDPGVADTGIINMGHQLIDRLADMIVRPIIHTPAQGAAPALRAATTATTATVFTAGGVKPIPRRWLTDKNHCNLIARLDEIAAFHNL